MAIPVFAWLVLRDRRQRKYGAPRSASYRGALGAVVFAAYNQARWGVWYDISIRPGITRIPPADVRRPVPTALFPYQLWSFFWQGPQFLPAWPYVVPT